MPPRQQGVPFGRRQIARRHDVPAGWEGENASCAGEAAASQAKTLRARDFCNG